MTGMKKDVEKITADLANLNLNSANNRTAGLRRQSATSNKENSAPLLIQSESVTNEINNNNNNKNSKKKLSQETFIISDLKW